MPNPEAVKPEPTYREGLTYLARMMKALEDLALKPDSEAMRRNERMREVEYDRRANT